MTDPAPASPNRPTTPADGRPAAAPAGDARPPAGAHPAAEARPPAAAHPAAEARPPAAAHPAAEARPPAGAHPAADGGSAAGGRRLTVFLVDDHAMFRAGVRAELGVHVDVVGEASSVSEAVSRIAATLPDVVLLDVHMPDGGGRAVLDAMRRTHPQVKFLALSVSDAAEDVIGLIRAGARGYVTKTISPDELAAAVKRVADGDAVFSPRLAGFVLDAFAARPDVPVADPELDQLTNREREVLRLLARGYAYKEIAKELFISIKTVETHVSNVLRKLQMSNRYELSRWAADRRLV